MDSIRYEIIEFIVGFYCMYYNCITIDKTTPEIFAYGRKIGALYPEEISDTIKCMFEKLER